MFKGENFGKEEVISEAKRFAWGWSSANIACEGSLKQASTKEVVNVSWQAPPMGWLKCNVDGSSQDKGCRAACAGVFRDPIGEWQGAFMRNLGSSNTLLMELWGILSALELAWDRGFRRLIIECDSAVAVQLISKECLPCHLQWRMVQKIKEWCSREWEIQIQHVFREGNMLADWLAKFAQCHPLGLQWLSQPPKECLLILQDDLAGRSISRFTCS